MASSVPTTIGGSQRRVAEYDIARVVSISCVVLIHVIAPYVVPEMQMLGSPGPVGLLSQELRFAVPMFVLLTGALLWNRPFGGATSWAAFFRRRFTVVLVPYLVWSLVFVAVGAVTEVKSFTGVTAFVRDLVLGTTWYHLYFVPIIVGVYVFAPVAHALFRRNALLLVAITTVVGVFAPTWLSRLDAPPATLFALAALVTRFLPYAALGAWYADPSGSLRAVVARWWVLLVAAGAGLRAWVTLGQVSFGSPYASTAAVLVMNALMALGAIGAGIWVARIVPSVVESARAWAPSVYGVYLFHPLLLLALESLAKSLGLWRPPFLLWMAIVWPLVTVGCFVAVRLASRAPRLWWLDGVAPARR